MNTKFNKSDFIVFGIYFLVDFTFKALDYQKSNSKLLEYVIDFPAEILTVIATIYVLIKYIIPNFLIKEKKYFHFFFSTLALMAVLGGIDYTAGFWTGGHDWSEFPTGFEFLRKMIERNSFDMALPFAFLLTKKFYEGQSELLKTQKLQKENELKLLRSQIDPHFLFNNLNTLDSLIDSDSEKAKEYINRLSLIYRYLIQTKDAEVMELSEELQFAENYIFLIKTRFGNDYEFTINKNHSIKDKFIPTGAIQTLLENVVKHNKPSHGETIKTFITIDEEHLKVSNKKSAFSSKHTLGTGLENLKTRYELLSDKEVSIINTESEFKVSIPIINLSE